MRSRSLNYMPALDGLRAVAVSMVFVGHALSQGVPFPGGLGVDVFFVISGFLITRILLRQLDATGTIALRRFYVARLLRLYPALAVVVAAVVLLYVVHDRGVPLDRVGYAVVAITYLSNIYMTVTGSMIDPLSHTWSLAMEEQFYLLWPPLLLLLTRARLSRRTIVLVVSGLATASLVGWVFTSWETPYNPLTRAGGLLVGCATALLVQRRPWHNQMLGHLASLGFVAVICAEIAGVVRRDLSMPIVTALLPFVILLAAFGDGPLVRVLSWRPLVHLGVISYGVYLWHYPLLYILHGFGIEGWTAAVAAAAATLIVCELSFRFVEAPALRLKDRLLSSEVRNDDHDTSSASTAST